MLLVIAVRVEKRAGYRREFRRVFDFVKPVDMYRPPEPDRNAELLG